MKILRQIKIGQAICFIEFWKATKLYFDKDFYLRNYPDIAESGINPRLHYMRYGWKEGRDPAPWFSTRNYLEFNPDVAESGVNPFYHYLKYGKKEGRKFSETPAAIAHFIPVTGSERYKMKLIDFLFSLHGEKTPVDHPTGMDESSRLEEIFSNILAADEIDRWFSENNGNVPLELHMGTIADHFDKKFYVANNKDIKQKGIDPLKHYCEHGWKELRDPCPDFDLWWYAREYLDSRTDAFDPFLHYILVGKKLGFKTRRTMPLVLRERAVRYTQGQSIRRICLFAGHDVHGMIDDYVVYYIKELAKFADVYYMSDCDMQPGELEKLEGFVKGAWGYQHKFRDKGVSNAWAVQRENHDFLSYSKLARDIVGWDTIQGYDELVLVNDNCWLLGSLDHVFSKMDVLETDWWGMQAAKTIEKDDKGFSPVPMRLYAGENFSTIADIEFDKWFNLDSCFYVFRKDVVNDGLFRDFFNKFVASGSNEEATKKYAVYLSRNLLHSGYVFSTFSDDLYHAPPLCTNHVFSMMGNGFPLFQRLLLERNPNNIPGLLNWKARLASLFPDMDTDILEKNLLRVADAKHLYASLRIRRVNGEIIKQEELLSNSQFKSADKNTPKYDHWWAFPVCWYNHTFSDNLRGVFESVRYNKNIKKIILTRSRHVNLDGENVEVVPLKTREGQDYLIRSKVIFIKHSAPTNVTFPLSDKLHHFIELWHGIPLKRIRYASLDMLAQLDHVASRNKQFKGVISSSQVDALAMAAAFYPLSYHDVWITGLPRNDFILRDFSGLPSDLQNEEQRLRGYIGSRRFILFCPTFRNGEGMTGYQFSDEEVAKLDLWLDANNAIIGIREHSADKHNEYSRKLRGRNFVVVSSVMYPNIEVLFRVSSCLITDYSSTFIDYMLTGKCQISFAYDYVEYKESERGMFYDLDFCFPGDICETFEDVMISLQAAVSNDFKNTDTAFLWKKRLFFKYEDDCNAERVVNKVYDLIGGS